MKNMKVWEHEKIKVKKYENIKILKHKKFKIWKHETLPRAFIFFHALSMWQLNQLKTSISTMKHCHHHQYVSKQIVNFNFHKKKKNNNNNNNNNNNKFSLIKRVIDR